jgi:hypothetical protein
MRDREENNREFDRNGKQHQCSNATVSMTGRSIYRTLAGSAIAVTRLSFIGPKVERNGA